MDNKRSKVVFLFRFFTFLAFSIGMSFHNTVAVLEGYMGIKSSFLRTPKFNIRHDSEKWQKNRYLTRKISLITILEGVFFLYFLSAFYFTFSFLDFGFLYFQLLLIIGFGGVFILSIKG